MMKKILLAALVAGSFGAVALPSSAAVVYVREAPPPPRTETMPPPRHGYVWAPGHWEWKHRRHTWVGGSWIRDRKGYVYNAPTWQEHDGRWQMQRGAWKRGNRDNDGDGVRNKDDARPNNPLRN
jgi:hypothetical protein